MASISSQPLPRSLTCILTFSGPVSSQVAVNLNWAHRLKLPAVTIFPNGEKLEFKTFAKTVVDYFYICAVTNTPGLPKKMVLPPSSIKCDPPMDRSVERISRNEAVASTSCSKILRSLPTCGQFLGCHYPILRRKRHIHGSWHRLLVEKNKAERAHLWWIGRTAFLMNYISKTRWPTLTHIAALHFCRFMWNELCCLRRHGLFI